MGNKVAIVAPSFFDSKGSEVMMGGGERYLVDLWRLLRDMGYDTTVFQCASGSWRNSYKGMPVAGVPNSRCLFSDDDTFSGNISRITAEYDHIIYFRFDFAARGCKPNSIGISHGIWWDYPGGTGDFWRTPTGIARLKDSVRNLGTTVSVDTNTINWIRAMDPRAASKMVYIPNYVDVNKFQAQEPATSRFTVLFPRRPVPQRGFDEALEAARVLTQRHKIRFVFLGKGSARTDRLLHNAGVNIESRWVDMDDMPNQYEHCDVALIPTIGAEGTSFSCLEAMASRRPVIASHVGGLANLVIDGYNGLLIQPTAAGIVEAVERMYEDRRLTRDLGVNAFRVAQSFNKDRWENEWRRVIGREFT